MARSWTVRQTKVRNQFKAGHFNDEANAAAQQFNGQLDQNNMPLDSVSHDKLESPVQSTNAFGVQTSSSYMATQSYHECTWDVDNQLTDSGLIGPATIFTTSWDADNWEPFFNEFDYGKVTQGSRLRFNAKEGMLYGGITISAERRAGRKTTTLPGMSASYDVGSELWHEIGVFVNGVLVGRTGKIPIGAYTIDLPFSTPVGTEFTEVVVKWSASVDLFAGSQLPSSYTNTDFRIFAVSGMHLWARCQHR